MPTGYTACIIKGATFKEFAMGCARAFGACVTMRDDSSDTKIPKEFKPSSYHKKEITKTLKEMKRIKAVSVALCTSMALKERKAEIKQYQGYVTERILLKKKYDAILKEVESYKAPTSDHTGFKAFMLSQIKDTIEHDCDAAYYQERLNEVLAIKPLSGEEWRQKTLAALQEDLDYHTKEDKEEVERVVGRNRWIRDLRKSLK